MSQMRAGLVGIEAGTEQMVLQMTAEGGNCLVIVAAVVSIVLLLYLAAWATNQ